MRKNLDHQRCTGLTVFRELACRQEQPRSTITQDVRVVDLLAFKLRHFHRVHFRRRRFTAFQQFAGVFAFGIGTAEELAETTGFELHLAAALVAFKARPFVALDPVVAFLDLVANAIRVVTADMQFVLLVQQVSVHGRAANRATVLAQQYQRLGFTFVVGGNFIARHQVDRGLAAFFRRQAVARATQEYAGRCRTNLHRTTTFLARNICHDWLVGAHATFRRSSNFKLLLEVAVELVQHVFPVALTLRNVIEVLFHAGGKTVVHQVGEAFRQALGNDIAHFFGVETAVVQRHVTTILNGRDNRRIGRRTTDTAFFHLFYQAGLGVTRRWLGEVLARIELDQLELIALGHVRQHIVVARLGNLRHHTGVTVEFEDATFSTQLKITGRHSDGGRQVFGRQHLACHELAPDQLVKALSVALHARQLARVHVDVGRTNRFVSLLCAFLAAVHVGCRRQVVRAELAFNVGACHFDRIGRQVGGVGTHVRDVARFIQALGHHHGFLHPVAQAIARCLLQGGRDKRRRRLAAGRFVFTLDDAVAGSLELLQGSHGLGFVQRLERLAFFAGNVEAHLGTLGGAKVGVNFPVFFGVERTNFALTLHHQLHRHRLHTACRQATGNLGPQQRRNHVTHYTVEKTACLLSVDPVDIQFTRLGKSFLNRLFGDFVEHHALVAAVITPDGFAQVPGNGFPLAIQVGCEIDGVSILGEPAQLFDDLFLAREDLVLGFPAMFRIDAHARDQLLLSFLFWRQGRRLAGRSLTTLGSRFFAGASRTAGGQVSDMADTRLHHVLVTQVLVDGLGLSRGFHNDQRFAHGSENS